MGRLAVMFALAVAAAVLLSMAIGVEAEDRSFKDDIIEDEEWLDPSNMFERRASFSNDNPAGDVAVVNFDEGLATVRPLTTRERNECREQRKEMAACKRKLRDLQLLRQLVDNGGEEPCADRDFLYLRRFAMHLIHKVKTAKHAPRDKTVKLDLYIPVREVLALEKILDDADCEDAAKIEKALSNTMSSSKASIVDRVPSSWF